MQLMALTGTRRLTKSCLLRCYKYREKQTMTANFHVVLAMEGNPLYLHLQLLSPSAAA